MNASEPSTRALQSLVCWWTYWRSRGWFGSSRIGRVDPARALPRTAKPPCSPGRAETARAPPRWHAALPTLVGRAREGECSQDGKPVRAPGGGAHPPADAAADHARRRPVGQVAVGADLVCAEDDRVQPPAARDLERRHRVEERRSVAGGHEHAPRVVQGGVEFLLGREPAVSERAIHRA